MTTAAQDATGVTLNWVFYDKLHGLHPKNQVYSTEVPRTLFDGRFQDCRNLFATTLLVEFAFQAKECDVVFNKVSCPSLLSLSAHWKQSFSAYTAPFSNYYSNTKYQFERNHLPDNYQLHAPCQGSGWTARQGHSSLGHHCEWQLSKCKWT